MDSCHDQIHPASTPLPKKKQNHDMLLSIQNKFEKEMKWKDKKKKKKAAKNISCILTILHCNGICLVG